MYPLKRTPHGEYTAVMYRWPFEQGDPCVARVIWVPMAQVSWRQRFGWRLVLEDAEIHLKLDLGQEWASPAKKPPFYPPPVMRPPDERD